MKAIYVVKHLGILATAAILGACGGMEEGANAAPQDSESSTSETSESALLPRIVCSKDGCTCLYIHYAKDGHVDRLRVLEHQC